VRCGRTLPLWSKIDFQIPSIIVSPIVEVFPYREELDREISRTPIQEEAKEEFIETPAGKRVFTAPGSDLDDDFEDEDSDLDDDFSEEE
jgi:hypothetical protein